MKLWCPELKDVPNRYIFEPWTMPNDVQKAASCRIGVDYPAPVVEQKVFPPRGGTGGGGGGGRGGGGGGRYRQTKKQNNKEKYKGGRYRMKNEGD